MKFRRIERIFLCLVCILVCLNSFTLYAKATQEELNLEAEERKQETVDTNEVEGWPQGPLLGAEGAYLLNVNTGAVLYSKNADERLYPASTTKIMTCLVAIENCDLDEVITINQSAIDANSSDGSNMGLRAGEQLTLEELLHGILINSANEACNAVAEHIAGSQEAFVEMMNARAKELGCTNTHFVSTNGLHNVEHYTTAHDLALIAQAFFSHDILCQMSSTSRYVIDATDAHLEHYLNSHNKLYEGQDYAYEYLVGSKTGFTNDARQTLVSCAEKNGMRLICVIMREESPNQFTDTVSLFEYGFNNFAFQNIKSQELNYTLSTASFFNTSDEYYKSTNPLIDMSGSDNVLLPVGVSFSDLDSTVKYDRSDVNHFANIDYTYHGLYVGSGTLTYNNDVFESLARADMVIANTSGEEEVLVDINKLLKTILVLAGAVILILIVISLLKKFSSHWFKIADIKRRRNRSLKKRPISFKLPRRPIKRTKPASQSNTNNGFVKRQKNGVYKPPTHSTLHPIKEQRTESVPRRKPDNSKKLKDFNFDDFNL